jgi:hypothetical protein
MAYTKANFQLFEEFPIENTVKEFMYLNAAGDSIATMTAAGYISDAGTKRVAVGDLVHVITQSPATYNIMQTRPTPTPRRWRRPGLPPATRWRTSAT